MRCGLLVLTALLLRGACGDPAADDAAFNGWFRAAARQSVEVRQFGRMGRGFVALEDIPRGGKVMELPIEWVVTREAILGRSAGDELKCYKALTEQTDCLALWLLTERQKGETSRWHDWLKVLPQTFDAPLMYTDSEVAEIEGPGVLGEVQRLRQDSRESYQRVIRELKKISPKRFTKKAISKHYALHDWQWATLCLSTRAWHMQGIQYMVPGAGMFNHDFDEEDRRYDWRTDTGARSQKFLTYHKIDKVRAVVYSDRDVSKGEQVFESYGDNRDSIYFNYHGFVPDNNPYACYPFALPRSALVGGAGSVADWKMAALRGAGVPNKVCVHTGEVPEKLLYFFAVGALPEKHSRCAERSGFSAVAKCGGGGTLRRKVYRRLIKALDDESAATFKSGSIADDDRLIEKGVPPRLEQVVRYRRSLKRLLAGLRSAVAEKLERVEQKAREHARKKAGGAGDEL